jgi:hypothetical protein
MKKSEMEEHHAAYHARMAAARAAEADGLYRAAVDAASAAWDYVDAMMQYERKYLDREFGSVPAIDLVLRYSPLLLDVKRLDALELLLKSRKRIERDTEADMAAKLRDARAKLWENHRLWSYLEDHPDARQDELRRVLGGDQDRWRWVAEAWERMGLVSRTPSGGSYRLALITRTGQVVRGKCPACGYVADAPKAMFFEPMTCPACSAEATFVILSAIAPSGAGE